MEFGSAFIGAIVLAIFIMPFFLTGRGRKKRERQILQLLTNIATQHNSQISQHEFCGDFAIGIDDTKNSVLFYKQTKDKVVEIFIDLADIQNCVVKNLNRSFSNREGHHDIIDKLELMFMPKAKNKKEISLEFFNADSSVQLYGELLTAEKWCKLINERLKIKK